MGLAVRDPLTISKCDYDSSIDPLTGKIIYSCDGIAVAAWSWVENGICDFAYLCEKHDQIFQITKTPWISREEQDATARWKEKENGFSGIVEYLYVCEEHDFNLIQQEELLKKQN